MFRIILRSWRLFLGLALVMSALCLSSSEPVKASWKPFEYRIGPRDILGITVFSSATSVDEEDTIVHRLPVSASGEIAMPLVGKIDVAGKTSSEL